MTGIDADDLAMLAVGFEAALRDAPDGDGASRALFELGWGDLLADSAAEGAAVAFAALGAAGAATGIVDDVLLRALGIEPSPTTAVVLPPPGSAAPPGRRSGDALAVDGMASSRMHGASTVVVPVANGDGVDLVAVRSRVQFSVDPSSGSSSGSGSSSSSTSTADALGVDPGGAYRRLRVELDSGSTEPAGGADSWDDAVAAGRVALAHQLVAASRTMLDQARTHAVDRVQFGRSVASFQAVRHKLAESLVHIEGAAAVVDAAAGDDVDPLLAALAKSLAGQAARTTATHTQQVLAGIGFTTDHPFQQWLKRTLVVDVVLGSARSLPAEIGVELVRRRQAPRLVELSGEAGPT